MDSAGNVLCTFTEVESPRDLSLNSEGCLLVADSGNDRILLLSRQLKLKHVLIDNTHSQVELWHPTRLRYSELASKLYIVHGSDRLPPWSDVISVFNLH